MTTSDINIATKFVPATEPNVVEDWYEAIAYSDSSSTKNTRQVSFRKGDFGVFIKIGTGDLDVASRNIIITKEDFKQVLEFMFVDEIAELLEFTHDS